MEGLSYNKKSILEKLDDTPQAGSKNAVTSEGIAAADGVLAGQISDLATQVATSFYFKGMVSTYAELPSSNNTINDTYYVVDGQSNAHGGGNNCWYSWNGTYWIQSSMSQDDYAGMIAQFKADMAHAYSASSTYEVGDLVLNTADNKIYVCKTAITVPEQFDPTKWDVAVMTDAIDDIVLVTDTQPTSATNKIWLSADSAQGIEIPTMEDFDDIIAAEYAATSAYNVGDYCMKDGLYYRCNTAIASGGEVWTPAHWTLTKVGTEITNVNNALGELIINTNTDSSKCVRARWSSNSSLTMYNSENWISYNGYLTDTDVIINTDNSIYEYAVIAHNVAANTTVGWYNPVSDSLQLYNESLFITAKSFDLKSVRDKWPNYSFTVSVRKYASSGSAALINTNEYKCLQFMKCNYYTKKYIDAVESNLQLEISELQSSVHYSLYDSSKLKLLDVTGTGTMRVGQNLGILPAGKYRIEYVLKPGMLENLYLTVIHDGSYSQELVIGSPFEWTLDSESTVYVRSSSTSSTISDFAFEDISIIYMEFNSTPRHMIDVFETDISNFNIACTKIFDQTYQDASIYHDYSGASFQNGYYDAEGVFHSSTNWRSANIINISPNTTYNYHGALLGNTACCCILDESNQVVGTVTGDAATSVEDIVYSRTFTTPATAKYFRYIYCTYGSASITSRSLYFTKSVNDYTDVKTLNYLSRHIASADKTYDVCIIGGGAGGIGAAYALKDSGFKVCIVDNNKALGGTHAQAWINVSAATPPPPFLQTVMQPLFESGKARYVSTDYQDVSQDGILWTDTYLRQEFMENGRTEYCIFFEPKAMSEKYESDLQKIDIYHSAKIKDVTVDTDTIVNITLDEGDVIQATTFIDCTGNDDMLRYAGGTTYLGEDSSTTYQSEYGFTEPNAPSSENANSLNQVELIYRINTGTESTVLPTPTSSQYVLPYTNVGSDKIYINSCNGFGYSGSSFISQGYDTLYTNMINKINTYWPLLKANGVNSQGGRLPNYTAENLATKKLLGHAPMLGIRESYRAKCERMLHESDLYTRISSENLYDANVLDTYIACGNHSADFHGSSNVNWSAINENRVPYGVKFGSLVPKGFKNLLVACRGAGFTHIGASSFRLNKDMMQIGWAAGKACELFKINDLVDFRNINSEELLDSEFTDFTNTVKIIESIMT